MFLRFAFGGEAYQNRALPFGLALFPCMFTKCMNAALALLRLQGIHAFNYIDDWLMLAQLEELAAQHQELVLTFRAQAEPQEECVFPHFSRYSVGFDHNAGTFVPCTCRFNPYYERHQARPRDLSQCTPLSRAGVQFSMADQPWPLAEASNLVAHKLSWD